MTGRELIRWIIDNEAFDKECVAKCRNGAMTYSGGEVVLKPVLASYEGACAWNPYYVYIDYSDGAETNCFVV